MVCDRETMRLVPHPLHQVQCLRRAVEDDRLRHVLHVQLLEALRQSRQRDLPDSEIAHRVVRS